MGGMVTLIAEAREAPLFAHDRVGSIREHLYDIAGLQSVFMLDEDPTGLIWQIGYPPAHYIRLPHPHIILTPRAPMERLRVQRDLRHYRDIPPHVPERGAPPVAGPSVAREVTLLRDDMFRRLQQTDVRIDYLQAGMDRQEDQIAALMEMFASLHPPRYFTGYDRDAYLRDRDAFRQARADSRRPPDADADEDDADEDDADDGEGEDEEVQDTDDEDDDGGDGAGPSGVHH